MQWPTLEWKHKNVHMFQCWRITKVTGDQVIFCIFSILCIYCIFLLWFYLIVVQLGWMRASPPLYTRAVNQCKSCMWIQFPPYWEGCLLFLSAIQGRYHTRCEGKQLTFQALLCDKTKDGKDGCRWWYVKSWALSWGTNSMMDCIFPKGSVAK